METVHVYPETCVIREIAGVDGEAGALVVWAPPSGSVLEGCGVTGAVPRPPNRLANVERRECPAPGVLFGAAAGRGGSAGGLGDGMSNEEVWVGSVYVGKFCIASFERRGRGGRESNTASLVSKASNAANVGCDGDSDDITVSFVSSR